MTAKVMFGAIGGIILIVGLFASRRFRTGSPAEVRCSRTNLSRARRSPRASSSVSSASIWREIGRVAPRRLRDRERRRTDRVRPDQRQRHGGRHRGQRRCLGVRPDARTRPVPPDEARRRGRDPRHPPRAGQADQTPDPPARDRDRRERGSSRTAKQTPTCSPTWRRIMSAASPIELSYDKFVGAQKESNRRKDIRLTSLESTVAVLEKELEKLERRLREAGVQRGTTGPSRRSNRSATIISQGVVGTRRAVESVIRTSTLATPNRIGSGQAATDGGTHEHPSHSRRITGHKRQRCPPGRPPLRHPTQTHRHRRSSSKRTTARTRRTRTTRRPAAVRIPTSRMTNRPSTPTTADARRGRRPASRRSTSAKSGWEPRRPTATPSTQPPVRSHSFRCRRRRRTHESRSRPRAPNPEGEQTLRVDYDDDAAPTDGESYYEVELFFEDGSTKTIGPTASGRA